MGPVSRLLPKVNSDEQRLLFAHMLIALLGNYVTDDGNQQIIASLQSLGIIDCLSASHVLGMMQFLKSKGQYISKLLSILFEERN